MNKVESIGFVYVDRCWFFQANRRVAEYSFHNHDVLPSSRGIGQKTGKSGLRSNNLMRHVTPYTVFMIYHPKYIIALYTEFVFSRQCTRYTL